MATQTDPSLTSVDFLIIAAEPSADLHAAALLEALFKKNPALKVEAIAGEKMRQYPITTLYPAETLSQIGLTGILKKGIKTLRLFYNLLNHIEKTRPKILFLIDFPFFNIKLAKALRRRGYKGKIYQYICPKVWVWGKKRIPHIAATFDELFTIFPFEEALFKATTLPVSYVGHPLIEKYPKILPFPNKVQSVGIFPGSRSSELKKHIPLLQETLAIIEKVQPQLSFVLFAATTSQAQVLKKAFPHYRIVSPENQQKELQKIDLAIAKSGTITLELALLGIPALVFYAATKLEEFWARKVLNITIPHISLPNILLQREVYKEILGKDISIHTLTKEFFALLELENRNRQRTSLEELRPLFGNISTASHLADLLFHRLPK